MTNETEPPAEEPMGALPFLIYSRIKRIQVLDNGKNRNLFMPEAAEIALAASEALRGSPIPVARTKDRFWLAEQIDPDTFSEEGMNSGNVVLRVVVALNRADKIIAGLTELNSDDRLSNADMVPLKWLLANYQDGDERGWDVEFDLLRREHSTRLDMLATSIQETGIQTPISLGRDGRVWDGHHRLCVASMLGLTQVPAVVAEGVNLVEQGQ